MIKFRIIDNTTKDASGDEVERIFNSFKERIATFCERFKVGRRKKVR